MTKKNLKLIGGTLVALLLLVLFAQNLERQTVHIFFSEFHISLAVLLAGTTIVGYFMGLLSAGTLRARRSKNKNAA